MSARHQGRHRTANGGQGWGPEPVEGRHRTAAGRPAAHRPVLAVSGTVAAALTAIVLSGAQGPLGALFPERDEEPRPTTASASPRGGAPTAGDIAQVARSYAAGPGGMGSSWGMSICDVLFQQDLESAPAMLDVGSASAAWWSRGSGAAVVSTPFLASAGTPSASPGDAPSAPPTAPPAPSAVGSSEPARTVTSQDPRVGEPDDGPGPQAPTAGQPPADDDVPADPLRPPAAPPVQGLPPAPTTAAEPVIKAAEPVIKAAEPVIKAAEPVIKAAEPVIKAAEPEPSPVPRAPKPVQEALESVGGAASEPEVEELPAGTGDGLDLPEVELPG